MKHFRIFALCFITVVLATVSCQAAALLKLELVADGSASPPGDRIDLQVLLEPDENELSVVVRAFVVDRRSKALLPVLDSELNKPFSIQRTFSREGVGKEVASIAIPYQSLRLAVGEYLLAYEVVGKVADQVVFVVPTRLTGVTITDESRRSMVVLEENGEVTTKTVLQKVWIAEDSTQTTANSATRSEAIAKQAEVEVPVYRTKLEELRHDVEIPQGFVRKEIVRSRLHNLNPTSDVPLSDAESLDGQAWLPLSDVKSPNERRILFATNRHSLGKLQLSADSGNSLHYGACIVNIPIQKHRRGDLELPNWWSRAKPEEHFTLDDFTLLKQTDFRQQLGENDVLLFVHGFNTSFENAVFRAAQLQHDLDFAGNSMAFSWPSAGSMNTDDYQADQNQADASVDALTDVLQNLMNTPETANGSSRKIHIIAHSMGNRLLLQSLYKLRKKRESIDREPSFGQIVLAAPDVGAIMFNNLIDHATSSCERVTYYYCQSDVALNISRKINLYEPVGLMPYFEEGLDTISANGADTSFINHGYYASSREVLTDIELLLKYARRPAERMPPLAMETEVFGHRCWAFFESKTN